MEALRVGWRGPGGCWARAWQGMLRVRLAMWVRVRVRVRVRVSRSVPF